MHAYARSLLKEQVTEVREYAEQNLNILSEVLSGARQPPGDDPRHVVRYPDGIKAVYSIDQDLKGRLWKHLSVSQNGGPPSSESLLLICADFEMSVNAVSLYFVEGLGHALEPLEIH